MYDLLEYENKRTGLNSIKRKYTTKKIVGEKVFSFKKCSFNHKLVKGNKEKLYIMTHEVTVFYRTNANECSTLVLIHKISE